MTRNRVPLMAFLFPMPLLVLFLGACGGGDDGDGRIVLRMNTDSIGSLLEISNDLAAEFEAETGIAVEFIIGPDSATDRLVEYQRFLGARSDNIDIYMIDVTWPGVLAPHLLDLTDHLDTAAFFPSMIENNMVNDRLVAAPYYADAPMLYYRSDLLEEAGFEAPPATWDELGDMARTIMDRQREAGNRNFHGFVFQGASYEGLTCNALEWQAAEGGGNIIDGDGNPEIDTEGAARAFERARGWVGTIAPRGVLTYMEEESRQVFHQGNAAFHRNWPYVYTLAANPDSPVHGKFAVAPLPSGEATSATTLGGWGLAVSRYSRHPDEAAAFVAFLSTRHAQRERALRGGYLATRMDIYDDPAVAEEIPYFLTMREVFENAVVRPARQAGPYYNEVSAAYYRAVHGILSGERNVEDALPEAENRIRNILE